MSSLVFLIPLALLLGGAALAAFLWSLRNGQYDDLNGAAERQQINVARQAIGAKHGQQAKHYRATLDRLNQALAALPEPCDEQRLIDAQTAMEQAAQNSMAKSRSDTPSRELPPTWSKPSSSAVISRAIG